MQSRSRATIRPQTGLIVGQIPTDAALTQRSSVFGSPDRGVPARLRKLCRLAAVVARLALQDRHVGQHFISRSYPIHRNGMTTITGTDHTQRTCSTRAANNLNFPAGDERATNKAITFLLQRIPLPELIEPP